MTEITQERRDQISAEQFVTYKWLIGTVISLLVIIVALIGIFAKVFNSNLESKVNSELYNTQHRELCSDIDDIKRAGSDTKKEMVLMNANMLLVMRALKIEPVR